MTDDNSKPAHTPCDPSPSYRVDVERSRAEKAEAERDAALAACAELRAAGRVAHEHACKMAEFHGPRCEEHERHDEAPADCLRCAADTAFGLAFADLRALLARPDLGAGVVVVPRESIDEWRDLIIDLVFDLDANSRAKRAIAELDALLKKGGG